MLKTIHAELLVHAPAERVFQAWTRTAELSRWLSEHADVALKENRFTFWGRYQPEAPDRDAAVQTLQLTNGTDHLRFGWRLAEVDTTVDVRLDEQNDVTSVVVEHTDVPESVAPIVEAFWSLSIENLRGWVELGVVASRHDFTTQADGDVHHSIDIDADPDAVFEALTEPRQIDRYMGGSSTIEPRVGGRIDYGWAEHEPMEILEIDPGRTLSHTWNYEGDDHAQDTIVTWTLEGSGGKTRLTLVHSGFKGGRSDDYQIGWLDFLNRIKFMLETGPGWIRPSTYGMHREPEQTAVT